MTSPKQLVLGSWPNAKCSFVPARSQYQARCGKKPNVYSAFGNTSHDAWANLLSTINGEEVPPPEPKGYRMSEDVRKTVYQLKDEYDNLRQHLGKTYRHNGSGDHFQVLKITFDEHTNEAYLSYCVTSTPWLSFHLKPDEFLERFTEIGSMK